MLFWLINYIQTWKTWFLCNQNLDSVSKLQWNSSKVVTGSKAVKTLWYVWPGLSCVVWSKRQCNVAQIVKERNDVILFSRVKYISRISNNTQDTFVPWLPSVMRNPCFHDLSRHIPSVLNSILVQVFAFPPFAVISYFTTVRTCSHNVFTIWWMWWRKPHHSHLTSSPQRVCTAAIFHNTCPCVGS